MDFQLILLCFLVLNGFNSLIFILKKINTYNSINEFLHPFQYNKINDSIVKKRLAFWLLILVLLLYIFSIVEILLLCFVSFQ